jgi:hypothetical protein
MSHPSPKLGSLALRGESLARTARLRCKVQLTVRLFKLVWGNIWQAVGREMAQCKNK